MIRRFVPALAIVAALLIPHRTALAQPPEEESELTPTQKRALQTVLEADLDRQGLIEGILSFRSLVCNAEPSEGMFNLWMMGEGSLATIGEIGRDSMDRGLLAWEPWMSMGQGLDSYLPRIAGYLAMIEQARALAEMERWGDPVQTFEDMSPEDGMEHLAALGGGPTYRPSSFGLLLSEYQTIMAVEPGKRSAQQIQRLRLLLPLVNQMLDSFGPELDDSEEPNQE